MLEAHQQFTNSAAQIVKSAMQDCYWSNSLHMVLKPTKASGLKQSLA
jgi:hypothetical protein